MFLSSNEFRDKLRFHLNSANREVIVLSAFIKEKALNWLIDNTNTRNIQVVTRWQPADLASRVSDVTCYKICRENGIKFGIAAELHAKVYCVDGHVFVGSANATARGLALANRYNDEFGVCIVAGKTEYNKLNDYLRSVTWVSDELYSEIENELSVMPKTTQSNYPYWSEKLRTKLNEPSNYIWVHDLPFNSLARLKDGLKVSSHSIDHDLELLGINRENFTSDQAIIAYKNCRAYNWCHNIVRTNDTLSFGGLTATLHNSLLDNPLPYRKEIKEFTQVLFNWAKLYPTEFKVTRPNYSEVIQIVKDV